MSDLAIEAYEQAYEPKKLVLLPGGISTPTSTSSTWPALPRANGSQPTLGSQHTEVVAKDKALRRHFRCRWSCQALQPTLSNVRYCSTSAAANIGAQAIRE